MIDPVVIVTKAGGGDVVRWHRTPEEATRPGEPLIEATVRGVRVPGWLTDVPAGWVEAAVRAHHTLRSDPERDMTGLATHRHDGPSNGPLVAVDPLAPARDGKGR